MTSYIDDGALNSFKSRLLMRLHLIQSSLESIETELAEMRMFLRGLPKGIFAEKELAQKVNSLHEKIDADTLQGQQFIDEVECLAEVTWQEITDLQERYLSLFILSNERVSEVQREQVIVMQDITKVALQKAKHSTRKKPPLPTKTIQKVNPVKEYSTPYILAMQAAIEKFWLKYDVNNLPTQKAVSNFIADKLGEPIQNRMTDDLAKAIRPTTDE